MGNCARSPDGGFGKTQNKEGERDKARRGLTGFHHPEKKKKPRNAFKARAKKTKEANDPRNHTRKNQFLLGAGKDSKFMTGKGQGSSSSKFTMLKKKNQDTILNARERETY